MDYRYVLADVFTDELFGGNQLAVLPDARGLSDATMQALTREFNLSETVFVFPAEDARHTCKLRIFTPGMEVPFAGHPTVGTAIVLAAIGQVPLDGATTQIVFEEGVGPIPVTITAQDGKPSSAQFTAARLPERGPAPPTQLLADLLGLAPDDVIVGEEGAAPYSAGVPFLFVPLRDQAAVDRATTDVSVWRKAFASFWAPHIYPFWWERSADGGHVYARMFAPAMNIAEDPATGAAAAALAGYLAARDAADGTRRWTITQGVAMGRPSTIHVEFDNADGALKAVRVGGSAVLVGEGVVRLPA